MSFGDEKSVQYDISKISKTESKEEIIEELMTMYLKKVYLLAYSFVKDHGIAEDISQEVFIKCFQKLHKYRGEASISSWIYRITVNTSKDFLRKNKITKMKNSFNLFGDMRKYESSEETFLKRNIREETLDLIFTLPVKYKEVLVLYYFHDQTIDEISLSLHINSNTVKSRMYRGKKRLKQKLNSIERGESI